MIAWTLPSIERVCQSVLELSRSTAQGGMRTQDLIPNREKGHLYKSVRQLPSVYRFAAVVPVAVVVVFGTVLWCFMSRSWGVRICPADSSGGGGIYSSVDD